MRRMLWNQTRITTITLLVAILLAYFYLILSYNVNITNLVIGLHTFFLTVFLIYNFILIFYISVKIPRFNQFLFRSYINLLLLLIYYVLPIEVTVTLLSSLLILKEINLVIFIKFFISLYVTTLVISTVFPLTCVFAKYRWFIALFGILITLSWWVSEARFYTYQPTLKTFLDILNIVIPYQSITALQEFLILEGWQGFGIVATHALILLIYWIFIIWICLYVYQLKTNLTV